MASRGNSSTAVATRPQGEPQQALVAVAREIDNRMSIVRVSAAAGIDADRLKQVALMAFTRTPALLACDPVSLARSIVEAGQLGLEPTGLLGGAYLVPRGREATLMIGYRGLVILAMRSGEVQRVEARVVRAKDAFEYEYGLEPRLIHKPSRDADPGQLSYAYAVIVYRNGERQFDVMSEAEIEAIRGRSSARSSGPWVTDYFEMAKKTVLRRLLKLAPLTVNVAAKLDEVDPEVEHQPAAGSGAAAREAELRAQLQATLEGDSAQLSGGNGNGGVNPSAQGGQPVEGAGGGASAAAEPASVEPERAGSAAAPAADPPATCGVIHEGLGVGPCVLPKDHSSREHEEAGGTRWTMPATAARR